MSADPPVADPDPASVPADPDPTPDPTFADLGLRPELLAALAELGYEEPTPIQREAIPPVLAGRDLLGQAATGTGKTAAFALPILERVADRSGRPVPVALVLVPTRELAVQVSEAVHRYGRGLGVEVLPIYGGQPIGRQLQVLNRGVHVVVATPGRAIDHIGRGTLPLDDVSLVVLDEADEMLDMGFAEDIEAILDATPEHRQTLLFSATMPPRIDAIARRHLDDPVHVRVRPERGDGDGAPLVRQVAYVTTRAHKPAVLGRVLDVESPVSTIVFCRTRVEVEQLTETLNGRGYRAEALHGGMDQDQRDRVMGRLRSGAADLIVATDVAARGLDIDQLTHVVNYDVPSAPDAYVHRIGRVGRAGREGVAITLVEPRERRLLANIERATRSSFEMASVPSVAALRARRMERTLETLRDALAADDLEEFGLLVDELAGDAGLRDVALAAVRLAHLAAGGDDRDDMEIPTTDLDADRGRTPARGGAARRDVADRPGRPGRPGSRGDRPTSPGMAKVYVGLGRAAGVRPQDLVGAITGETDLTGKQIGAITVTERFALVEVPEDHVDAVIARMAHATIRGRRANVRRDRDEGHPPRR